MKKTKMMPKIKECGNFPSMDQDEQAASEYYLGKTDYEMQQMLTKCIPFYLLEYLRYVPPIPFQYFTRGYCQFILDEKFKNFEEPLDVESLFCGVMMLIGDKALNDPGILVPIHDVVIPTLIYIADQQKNYDLDIKIYGDFNIKKDKILNLLES